MNVAVKTAFFRTLPLLLLGTSPIFAAPFDSQQVPEGAKWLIHVDFEAFRGTAAGQAVRDEWLAKDKVQAHLQKVQEEIGMNPSEDILSATLYDTQFQKEHGVAMIHVRKVDGKRLLARFQEKEPDNKMVEFGSHKIYIWQHAHGGKEHAVCGSLYKEKVVVFSRDVLKVMAALEVLDGKKPALSASDPLAKATADGTVLLVRGVDLSSAPTKHDCPVLKDSKSLEAQIGAHEGKSFLNLDLHTNSEEIAQNAKTVVDGFRALVNLRHRNEQLQKLLSNLEVTTSEANVSLRWSMDEGAALEAAKELRQHGKKHGEELRKRWRERAKADSEKP
jgi:hypothetical protein